MQRGKHCCNKLETSRYFIKYGAPQKKRMAPLLFTGQYLQLFQSKIFVKIFIYSRNFGQAVIFLRDKKYGQRNKRRRRHPDPKFPIWNGKTDTAPKIKPPQQSDGSAHQSVLQYFFAHGVQSASKDKKSV